MKLSLLKTRPSHQPLHEDASLVDLIKQFSEMVNRPFSDDAFIDKLPSDQLAQALLAAAQIYKNTSDPKTQIRIGTKLASIQHPLAAMKPQLQILLQTHLLLDKHGYKPPARVDAMLKASVVMLTDLQEVSAMCKAIDQFDDYLAYLISTATLTGEMTSKQKLKVTVARKILDRLGVPY